MTGEEVEKSIKRIKARVATWSLNSDSARVSVRLGDLRAVIAAEAQVEALTKERDDALLKYGNERDSHDVTEALQKAAEAQVAALRKALEEIRGIARAMLTVVGRQTVGAHILEITDAALAAEQVQNLHELDEESGSQLAEGLDTPLPCDVEIAHIRYRKGVKLRTLVDAGARWHALASRGYTVETALKNIEAALCDACQILNKAREEWAEASMWSEWDQATFDKLSHARIAAVAALEPTAPAEARSAPARETLADQLDRIEDSVATEPARLRRDLSGPVPAPPKAEAEHGR